MLVELELELADGDIPLGELVPEVLIVLLELEPGLAELLLVLGVLEILLVLFHGGGGGSKVDVLLHSWDKAILEGDPLGNCVLSGEELVAGKSSLTGDGIGEDILLEGISLAGDLEGDGLDHGGVELEGTGDLNLRDVAGALGEEGHTTLGIGALVLGERELPGLLIDHLEVADVSVSLSGKVEHLGVLIVEGHQDTGGGIEVLLDEGLGEVGRVPDEHLTVGGLGETGGGEPIGVGEPNKARALNSLVSSNIRSLLSRPDVEDLDPLVLGGTGNEGTVGVEGEGVDLIGVSEDLNLFLSLGDVPKLDGQISTGGGEGVVSNRVEGDLSDLAGVGSENNDGLVHRFLEFFRDVPDHDLGILRAGGDDVIIEGVEIDVEDDGLVSLEEGRLGGELSSILNLSNPEGTSTGGLPAAGNEAGVGLQKIGIPSIAGGLEVINASLLLGAGTKNVAILGSTDKARHLLI